MDGAKLLAIDRIVADGIRAGEMPGCVVTIGRHGKIVFQKAYGDRQVEPHRLPMTVDAVFDMASLTKPMATATSVMILVEEGKIDLEAPVARYLPEFGRNGKEKITVFHLLTHQSGLVPDNPLGDYEHGPQEAWERIFALTPIAPPGKRFVYSDVNFLVLGELVRRVSGKDLHEFSREHIYRPLGMMDTGFLPAEPLRRRAAPTEQRGGRWIKGEVHDPRSFLLGGISGHAGLFSTADDLAVYAAMMLGHGEFGGVRILQAATVERMTRAYPVSSGLRGLGWDIKTAYSINRGESFSSRAFGHGGFTGTVMWIDPELDLLFIFLSNRLHPDGKGTVNPLAGRIGTVAGGAVRDKQQSGASDQWSVASGRISEVSKTSEISPPAPLPLSSCHRAPASPSRPSTLTGIDVLQRDGFRLLAGRRLGLITNQTGINRQGVSTARLLRDAPGVTLVALLSPEHGLEGKLDQRRIPDARDPVTGLPVYSLYGDTRRPTDRMLRGIDTLVFDIQDIGTRFYTYISTMGQAMQAAAEHKLRFVVLDRPNPIGGVEVAGPVLDAGRESFVAFHRLPVRHGMTVGELARMFQSELKLDLDLEVVRVEGWRRDDYFDATGLPWVNPSPNMRSLTEAILYPGIGLLETTNLSVGRGTATPFELVGAPWIDGKRLVDALERAHLAGVRFSEVVFTPDASVFQGQRCQGLRIAVTDRSRFEPIRTGLEIARQLRLLYPHTWKVDSYDRLLGNRRVLDALRSGKTVAEMESLWRPELREFMKRRERFLLYPNSRSP